LNFALETDNTCDFIYHTLLNDIEQPVQIHHERQLIEMSFFALHCFENIKIKRFSWAIFLLRELW